MVTAAFLVGIDGLVLAQGLIVRACSDQPRSASTDPLDTVVTVLALKRVSIDEAFVAHEAEDLEHVVAIALALAVWPYALGLRYDCELARR